MIFMRLAVRSRLNVDTPSPPPLRGKLSVMSRKSFATLLSTSRVKWLKLLLHLLLRNPMNFPMARLSPSVTNVSVLLNLCSSLHSWAWNLAVPTKLSSTQSCSVTLISVRTCTPTLFFLVVPPCTLVLLIVCRKKSLLLLLPPSRSRSLLPLSENTPYGSVAPSLPLSPLSRLCGSPRKNTTNPAPDLFTASASNLLSTFHMIFFCFLKQIIY